MFGLLRSIRQLNGLGARAVAEPFAGGAGASLSMLFLEETPAISINDADPAMHDLWWSLLNKPDDFQELVSNAKINMTEWRRQREVYRSKKKISRLRRGFSAFYLNRCNRSGIIVDGGPIGGMKQEGKWKLGARYNRDGLVKRCLRIADYKERIAVSGEDGIEFIRSKVGKETFLFIDPPYFEKGPTLYLNTLDETYHERLAGQLKKLPNESWILTYDDCPEIRSLYKGWATIRPFSLRYSAAERRSGREVLIAPKWIKLPAAQQSEAIHW